VEDADGNVGEAVLDEAAASLEILKKPRPIETINILILLYIRGDIILRAPRIAGRW
jgi:hypothetical protein